MFTASRIYLNPPVRYIPSDTAKCAGNPVKDECKTCLRFTLPVNPAGHYQTHIGPWLQDEPCPLKWTEK